MKLVCIPGTLCDARVFAPLLRQPALSLWRGRTAHLDRRAAWEGDAMHARGLTEPTRKRVVRASLPPGDDSIGMQRLRDLSFRVDRSIWMGFSLGALHALRELAKRQALGLPQPAGLVLIAGNARGASAAIRRASTRSLRQLIGQGQSALIKRLLPRYGLRPRSSLGTSPATRVRQMGLDTPRALGAAQLRHAMTRADTHKALSEFEGPVLLISGARDRVVPKAAQLAMLHAQPQAAWQNLPRCGHFPLLDAPAATANALARWLKEHFHSS